MALRKVVRRSVHEQILTRLRAEIASRQAGDRLPGENTLARQLGVSNVTVAKALAVLDREGKIQRRVGSGTYVQDRAADQYVGVLIDSDISHPRTSYFYVRVAQRLRALLEADGLRPRLYAGQTPPTVEPAKLSCREFLEDLRADKLQGLATVVGRQYPEWEKLVQRNHVAVVGSGFAHGVDLDGHAMVRQATRKMLAAGRRKIAFMTWEPWENGHAPSDGWVETFTATLREAGVPVEPGWIRHEAHPSAPGAGWEEFREIWYARAEKPDALLVGDDLLMRDAISAICDARVRVPDELMIVAHANRGSGIHYPFPVWQMEFDPDEYARLLHGMLSALLRKETVTPPRRMLPFRWVNPLLKRPTAVEPERSHQP